MTEPVELNGNIRGKVVRIGNTVRRWAGPWTPAVHALLRHLESAGFAGAPRVLGVDDDGHELLRFVPGIVVGDQPLTDAELRRVARIIRDYHEAVGSFQPPQDARWHPDCRDPSGANEVVCHNDFGTWNLVVGPSGWVFIDWDLAAPGRRLWDLAVAACTFVPLYPSVRPRMKRYALFCEAYGADPAEALPVIVERIDAVAALLVDGAAAGREPYVSQVRDGHGEFWRRTAEHVRSLRL